MLPREHCNKLVVLRLGCASESPQGFLGIKLSSSHLRFNGGAFCGGSPKAFVFFRSFVGGCDIPLVRKHCEEVRQIQKK